MLRTLLAASVLLSATTLQADPPDVCVWWPEQCEPDQPDEPTPTPEDEPDY